MGQEKRRPLTHENRPGVTGANENDRSRYILCPFCREFVADENEPDRVVMGHVKRPDVRCDRCGEPLPVGSPAAAASFSDRPEDDEPWEHEHLTTH
jgi:hypothetical protein